ncbi:restriction endonuclease subunit S [Chryseobacterium sp. 'Rf worker isolate 10']|uniref:restriction endonuclease subunit S n=1 Tax=Chryseobacterium sp. 'Rf worker isolate 10' TaxID=2887348 RepID=UPI003D6DB951
MKWNKEQISSFTEVVTGGTPATDKREYWEKGTISWLNSGDLNQGVVTKPSKFITEEGYKNSSTKLMPSNTVLIALTGATTGLSAILKIEACANQSVTGILPSSKHYPEFLYYYFKTQRQRIFNAAWGGAQPHINQKYVKDYIVPLPPIVEQIKIATILNKAEVLIKQCKESIDLLDVLLKSTFMRMFGNPVRNEKKWNIDFLSQFGEFKNGLNFSKSEKGFSYLCLGVGDFKNLSTITDIDSLSTINLSKIPSDEYFLRDNDFVFVRSNGNRELVGRCITVFPREKKVTFSGFCIRFRLKDERLNSIYLNHLFRDSSFKRTMLQNGRGANIQNINQEILGSSRIPLPPKKLQNQFAAIVEKTEILKTQLQSSLSDLEELYASLTQRAFKGELDLSAVEIDKTLLPDVQKVEPVISIPPNLQKAILLSDKINKQFGSIGKITKVPSALTRQLEHWNKLQNQFKSIPKLPEALLQAQKNMQRIQETFGLSQTGSTKIPVEEETGFNWEVLANRIKERYKNLHFNFEMLHSFIQKDKLAEATPYYSSEELKTNPRLNDAEDLKTFIQTAIRNIEMDEKQQRQTNPFLRLTQSFYNAEIENFVLSLHKEDFKLIKDKTARQRSGIYFSLAPEA